MVCYKPEMTLTQVLSSCICTHKCPNSWLITLHDFRLIPNRATCLVCAGPRVMAVVQEIFTQHIIKRRIKSPGVKMSTSVWRCWKIIHLLEQAVKPRWEKSLVILSQSAASTVACGECKSDSWAVRQTRGLFKTTLSSLDSNFTTRTFLSRVKAVVSILGTRYLIFGTSPAGRMKSCRPHRVWLLCCFASSSSHRLVKWRGCFFFNTTDKRKKKPIRVNNLKLGKSPWSNWGIRCTFSEEAERI